MRLDFIWLFFCLLFSLSIFKTLFDIFLYEILIVLWIRFGHLIEHFPYIVSHVHILLCFKPEHLLELLWDHSLKTKTKYYYQNETV